MCHSSFHLTIITFWALTVLLHCWYPTVNSHDYNHSQRRFFSYETMCHVDLFSGPHCIQSCYNYTVLMGVMCGSSNCYKQLHHSTLHQATVTNSYITPPLSAAAIQMWRLSLISLHGLICSKAFVGICMQGSYEKNTNAYINHLCVCVRACELL